MALSDREMAIIDLERTWFLEPGSKEQAIRARLDLSPARYYELINELLEDRAAADYDPLVVRRLRRQREHRRRARFEGRSAGERPNQ